MLSSESVRKAGLLEAAARCKGPFSPVKCSKEELDMPQRIRLSIGNQAVSFRR